MTDRQKAIADEVISYFQFMDGRLLTLNEIFFHLQKNYKREELAYVVSMLTIKGLLHRKDPIIINQDNLRDEQWYLSETGWVYTNWLGLESEEEIEEQDKRKKEQLELEHIKSSVQTNKSVKDTNIATKKLYEETLPKNFDDQRRFGNKTLIIGLLSTAFIGLTFWKEYRDTTPSKLQDLSSKSDSLRIELKNIRSAVESVNRSIERITTDTFVVKKK
jgi:hypothetical protein